MNTTPDNKAVMLAGQRLIQELEGFIEDADDLAQRDHLKEHVRAMHLALQTFKQNEAQMLHKDAAHFGLC